MLPELIKDENDDNQATWKIRWYTMAKVFETDLEQTEEMNLAEIDWTQHIPPELGEKLLISTR